MHVADWEADWSCVADLVYMIRYPKCKRLWGLFFFSFFDHLAAVLRPDPETCEESLF